MAQLHAHGGGSCWHQARRHCPEDPHDTTQSHHRGLGEHRESMGESMGEPMGQAEAEEEEGKEAVGRHQQVGVDKEGTQVAVEQKVEAQRQRVAEVVQLGGPHHKAELEGEQGVAEMKAGRRVLGEDKKGQAQVDAVEREVAFRGGHLAKHARPTQAPPTA